MIISIFGPTASGKSTLALKLAKELSGEIINCDSVQIYRDFIIGAAQPSQKEMQLIPHHLYGVLEPNEKISVGLYQKLSSKVITEIKNRGKIPFIVGGTSLYLTALLYGLADIPSDEKIRAELEKLSNEKLIDILKDKDPESANKLHPNDRVRILRAVEIIHLGLNLTSQHSKHQINIQLQHNPTLIVVPMWDRATLYDRIQKRTELMFQSGVIQECKDLLKKYPNSDPLESIGYKEICNYLNSKSNIISTEHELINLIAMNTRRFAKRQMTWLRNEPIKKNWSIRPIESELMDSDPGDLSRFPKPSNIKNINSLILNFDELTSEIKNFISNKNTGVHIWFVNANRTLA
jgi:tRNA dimethylallyltransferase